MIKSINFVTFFISLLICSCNTQQNKTVDENQSYKLKTLSDIEVDSLKWYFYAYSYDCDVLFKGGNEPISFKSFQCDIKIECEQIDDDTLFAKCIFIKDSLNGIKIYNCISIDRALYYKGVFKPLTGHLVVEGFQDPIQLRQDNNETIEKFKYFLKMADTSLLSPWLMENMKEDNLDY